MYINPDNDLILFVLGNIDRMKNTGTLRTNLKLTANAKKRFAKLIRSGYYADSDTIRGVMEVLKTNPDIKIEYVR